DAQKWIKIFTFLSKAEIENLIKDQEANAAERNLQKTLAKELTVFVHGNEEYEKALETTQKLFANQNAVAETLSEEDLNNIEGLQKQDFAKQKIVDGIDATTLLTETNIFPSKGEAKKMIQNGGVSINRKKIDNPQQNIEASQLLHDKYLLVQKGKKNYYLLRAV
ncbi:MAG: S4 domain-containing protein, partial [Ferruginibacter sp.]